MPEARQILIPVDESQAAIRAFNWALDNLYRPGDEYVLLHIIPTGRTVVVTTDLGLEGVVEDDDETKRKTLEHAEAFLKEWFCPALEQRAVPYRLDIQKCNTDTDSLGALICQRAEELGAAAVVMAKHNKGALREFFVGSVTNYCTHRCKSPVLVMQAD